MNDASIAAMDYVQTERFLQIDTPLGHDSLLLVELDGVDAISAPFVFNLELVTYEKDADVKTLLGKAVTLTLHHQSNGEPHLINGLVRRLTGSTLDRRQFRHWHAEVVPKFWFLSCVADCRIFQNKSVPDILEQLFQEHGLVDYEIRATRGNYPKLEYCVQYRETTFDFASRLMQHSGLFYWHEHSDGKHVLVVADDNIQAKPLNNTVVVLDGQPMINDVQSFQHDYAFRPGKWTLRDFDFESPTKSLTADTPTILDVQQMAKHEIYDYPGGYTDRQVGTAFTRRLIEAEEMQYDRLRGAGTALGLDAGRRCTARINDPDVSPDDSEFVLTEVRHHATDRSHITNDADPVTYQSEFTATRLKVPFRPPLTTPRPIVRGPQTAVVTGPAGEHIFTDKYGRVKVRFHWDRNPDGNQDDSSSCWIRVSQGWAGRNWGAIHLPRIGQEVIVDFLEGDPDRPIITGRVYNGDNPVPYELPANATQSGIKSRSVPGSGSNEFRFEDKQGSEEIWLHAQKDMNAKVENDETRVVGKDRSTTIQNNETKKVNGNFSETVQGTETRKVVGNVSETFSANETRSIGGNISETVGGSVTETVGGSVTQTVAGGITITTPGAISITAAGGFSVVAPGGTRYVDNFFDKTGGKNFQAYAMTLSISAMKTDIVAGLSLGYTMNKIDINSMKVDLTGFWMQKKGTEMKTVGDIIMTAYLNLHTIGLYAIM